MSLFANTCIFVSSMLLCFERFPLLSPDVYSSLAVGQCGGNSCPLPELVLG